MVRFALPAALCTVLAAGALAEEPGPTHGPARTPNYNSPETDPNAHPTAPPANPYAIAAAMNRNGGSLVRAAVSLSATPGKGAVSDLSLFSVPAPIPKTLKKHDLVTVIIREESDFSSKGTTDLKKSSDLDAKIDAFVKLSPANLAIIGGAQGATPPEVKASGSRNTKGEATVDRTDTFTARIQAQVVDVKPNGTLVIEARKSIKTDEEEQEFILTGIIRADDVDASNSVLSTQMFDQRLEKQHKGAVRDTTRRGWLSKLLDVISPF